MAELKRVFRYSEAFKMQVISELESGKLASQAQTQEHYGIAGGSSVEGGPLIPM